MLWKSGLKTGMYYLRTKSAVDAIKFTLDNKKKSQPESQTTDVPDPQVIEKKQEKAAKTAENLLSKKLWTLMSNQCLLKK